MTVTGSTFTDDTVSAYGAGAIGNGFLSGSGTLSVTDSTFADDSGGSGAIDNASGGTGAFTVTGSTFTDDSATQGGTPVRRASRATGANHS